MRGAAAQVASKIVCDWKQAMKVRSSTMRDDSNSCALNPPLSGTAGMTTSESVDPETGIHASAVMVLLSAVESIYSQKGTH